MDIKFFYFNSFAMIELFCEMVILFIMKQGGKLADVNYI
jgi:hypothetical protein